MRLRFLLGLVVCGLVTLLPDATVANDYTFSTPRLYVNIQHEGDGSKRWEAVGIHNCKAYWNHGNNKETIACADTGSLKIAWYNKDWDGKLDAQCTLSEWWSGSSIRTATWHTDFSRNDRKMCTGKWENDNTYDIVVRKISDYRVNIAGLAANQYILSSPSGDCIPQPLNQNGATEKHMRCFRPGEFKIWDSSHVCEIRVGYNPMFNVLWHANVIAQKGWTCHVEATMPNGVIRVN